MTQTPTATKERSASTAPDVAAALRQAIASGKFVPNQRLVEIDLCDDFGASRAAVRSALQELTTEGLIEHVRNRGSRVRAVPLAEAIEITEVRSALEGLCAAKAASRISNSETAEFQVLRAAILEAAASGQNDSYSELNQQLDRRILEISGHETAAAVLHRLRAQVVRHQFKLASVPGRSEVSAAEHAAIIDAIVARDPDAAEAAVRRHMLSVARAMSSREGASS